MAATSTKQKVEEFQNLDVAKSESFTEIMAKYDSFGRHMSMRGFHATYVKPLDPTITFRKWEYFIKKFAVVQNEYIANALAKSNENALSEAKMESSSLKNILQIADVSLQELVDKPELVTTIPIAKRMQWFFAAMKARDTRFKTNLAAKQEAREQSMFEKMMEGAQYGGYAAEQVPVVDAESNQIDKEYAEEQPIPHELPGSI